MDQRAAEMYELYEQGATLEEVGICYGITRERVRQIFHKAGLASRSPEESNRKYSDAELLDCLRVAADALGGALNIEGYEEFARTQTFADGRRWPNQATIGTRFGSFVKARNIAGVRGKARKRRERLHSDAELINCLKQANSALGGVLTHAAYDEFARDRSFADGRSWPTSRTPSMRFGTWVMALQAAGLQSNPSSGPGQRFDVEDCVDAVRAVARELGKVPTTREYEEFARRSHGALPSLPTIRHRCGRWAQAIHLVDQTDGNGDVR